MFDNERYRKEKKKERDVKYKEYHTCSECGAISRSRLKYGHPTKYGMICAGCRKKLWKA